MSTHTLLVVGSLNCDLVAGVDRFPTPGETVTGTRFFSNCGGKGANQAYAAASLEAKVAMIGQVGNDDFGSAQIGNLSQRGVDTDGIGRDPGQPTGTALVSVNATGENQIILIPGANGTLSPEQIVRRADDFSGIKTLLLQLEIPLKTTEKSLEIAAKNGTCVILDPAPAAAIPLEWYRQIDYLTPNETELGFLTNTISQTEQAEFSLNQIVEKARVLCDRGVACVIVKLGSRGVLRVSESAHTHFPAPHRPVVDTTAAGDCFNGALAAELAAGRPESAAIEFAVRAASLSVTRPGAQASMPTRRDLEDAC